MYKWSSLKTALSTPSLTLSYPTAMASWGVSKDKLMEKENASTLICLHCCNKINTTAE